MRRMSFGTPRRSARRRLRPVRGIMSSEDDERRERLGGLLHSYHRLAA